MEQRSNKEELTQDSLSKGEKTVPAKKFKTPGDKPDPRAAPVLPQAKAKDRAKQEKERQKREPSNDKATRWCRFTRDEGCAALRNPRTKRKLEKSKAKGKPASRSTKARSATERERSGEGKIYCRPKLLGER